MDGGARSIFLQEENTWPLRKVWIFLDNYRVRNATQHLSCGQPVLGQLIVSVFRYPNIASMYQCTDFLREIAQAAFSISASIIFKA
jgi:hypothetical protein